MTQVKTRKQRVMFNVEHSVQYLPPQGGGTEQNGIKQTTGRLKKSA
jgi:3-deoxy-D-manno-octulosonic acid (KDO) 8-phosphate synthase